MAEPARINYSFWLTFSASGSVRLSKNPPRVEREERTMKLTATLPKALFTEPTLSATITVNHVDDNPPPINVELASAALRGVLGVDIDLKVHE